jgi:hypothetical protein
MDNSYSYCPGPLPDDAPDPDPVWTEYVAWLDREADAGRDPSSEPWPPEEDEPWDPDPGAVAPARFWPGEAADELPPAPQLARLTEDAVLGLGQLSDNELIGVLHATRRQLAREQYKQVLVTAEFGRRRQAAFRNALARGVPAGCRPGGFPGEELAAELLVTRAEAGHLIDDAIDLTSRLPRTLAGMAAGQIDAERAGWIAMYTHSLAPADAARADEVLAEAAPDLRTEQVARKAAALEMKLNPEAVAARKEHAKRTGQRVEARREVSGNASLAGRELDTADVLASKAHLDAIAVKLRASSLIDGPLDRLRALALIDLTQGRDPLDRIRPACAPADSSPAAPADPGERPAENPGGPALVPALINLIVPAGTLLGFSTAPAQVGAWGLLDGDETRAVTAAAAAHPATRWCVTLTGPAGIAVAHGCARGPRPRLLSDLEPQPPPAQLAELLHRLNLTFAPIARGSCDHAHTEDGYVPSRKLRHLIRARRTHHRAKQAPDWTVDQLAPGVSRWTLPSGRTHVTAPTSYDTLSLW